MSFTVRYRRIVVGVVSAVALLLAPALTVSASAAEGPTTHDVSLTDPVLRGVFAPLTTVTLPASGGTGTLSYTTGPVIGPGGGASVDVSTDGNLATVEAQVDALPGDYAFTYTASDETGASSTSTVRFTIVNTEPVVRDLTFSTVEGTAFDGWPWARDRDA